VPRGGPGRLADLRVLDARHHHLVAGLETLAHYPLAAGRAAEGDVLARHLAVGPDDHHVGTHGIAQHRLLRDQEHLVLLAELRLQCHVHARQQGALRVRHHRTQVDRAGGRVDRDVGEIQHARLAVGAAVGHGDLHAGLVPLGQGDIAAALRLAHLLERVHAHGEVDVHRVDLVDRGEQGGLAVADQRALGDLLLAGAAGDRRGDVGIAEVDACGLHACLRRLHRGGAGALGGQGVVQVGLRHVTLGRQFAHARSGDLVVGVGGPGLGQRGLGCVQRGLQRGRVDLEQQLALLDVGAFVIGALEQHAGHAGAHVGAAVGREPADQVAGQRRALGLRLDHADFRRWHLLRAVLVALAAGAQGQQAQAQQCRAQ
jgi:hypothetical protein